MAEISISPLQHRPAEVVKITFTLLLAKQLEWLREVKRDLKSFPSALMVAGHTIALMGWYVGISGDMGNGLTFFFIFLCMAFVAGFALRWFVLLFAGSGAAIAASVALGLMPDYMINRFRVLFDHSYDTLGAGWQQTRACWPWAPAASSARDTCRAPRLRRGRGPCRPGTRTSSSVSAGRSWG